MSGPAGNSARAHILVVEDSSVFREMQGLLLGQAGFAVSGHESPQAALAVAAKQRFDLVVIDYELPEMNGEQFMHALRKIQPNIAVIFVSGTLTIELAVNLSSQGVSGIFNKPVNPKILIEKINETLFKPVGRDTTARVGSGAPLASSRGNGTYVPPDPVAGQLAYTPHHFVGDSPKFRDFTHRLWKVRDFRTVLLLQGEPGSAFELFARDLAEISIFRDGPVMQCDAADFEPKRLIQELAPALLSQDAGTFILTGAERLTPEQQKTFENLLTGRDVFLTFARRFRVVVAATPALAERVDSGAFNETLFYKISALSLTVPPLRDLRSDLAANVTRLLARHAAESGTPALTLGADAAAWLETQAWPGNYEELARTVASAIPHARNGELDAAALDAGAREATAGGSAAPANSTTAAAGEAAPVVVAVGRSLFRPASATYDFNDRLTALLAVADAAAAA